MKYIYGPVPSRRLGLSLGISPIPQKTCNYSCIYCQLGRTNPLTNERKMFFPVEEILKEFEEILKEDISFDIITIVGEGEPTLYLGLGELIEKIHKRTKKPIAVITNGALLFEKQVREELFYADMVLPTLDAVSEEAFQRINRPHRSLSYQQVIEGLRLFSKEFQGEIWVEIMLIQGYNDKRESFEKLREILSTIRYDRLYLNTPIRPPAEEGVFSVSPEKMKEAVAYLGGISIELLSSQGFFSEIKDHKEAVLSIIKRHPMAEFEVVHFLKSRGCIEIEKIQRELERESQVIFYQGERTFRGKK